MSDGKQRVGRWLQLVPLVLVSVYCLGTFGLYCGYLGLGIAEGKIAFPRSSVSSFPSRSLVPVANPMGAWVCLGNTSAAALFRTGFKSPGGAYVEWAR